jgi:hypothetical protein
LGNPEPGQSGGTQHDIDPDGVEGKNNEALLGLLQNACLEQGVYIAVYGFHVAGDPPRRLPDRYRARAGQGPNEFPALRCQQPKQQFRAREAYPRALLFSLERISRTPLDVFEPETWRVTVFILLASVLRHRARNPQAAYLDP